MELKRLELNDLGAIGIEVFPHKIFNDSRGSMNVNFELQTGTTGSAHISFKRSFSHSGVGRGLHHQAYPGGQDRIVSIFKGAVVDFLFDASEPGSPLFCFDFKADDNISLYLPKRFAHGFISLSEVVFEYYCIGRYVETTEYTINVLADAARALDLGNVILSEKDASFEAVDATLI